MKVSFTIGLIIAIVAYILGFLMNDYNIALKISGFLSAFCIVICGILNGSFVSGDKYLANYLSEGKDDKNRKTKIVNYLLIILIPNIVVCIIVLMLISFRH
ncbi:DUF5316 domain-containing protein [Clostridium beijerinckii]|uniref:DUF5316 domain-containing protein n=1 Tax=Clostridium beijerinckii TaxID=1520 RepID=A0A1S8RE03_CLOBE|nr:DUF5316 domain-containing protein [Clostridium beijerinckii]NRY59446.1 putative membrane protein [Clostridium beijerinckii]OOM51406.1 hypothetical protein CLBCK_50420 [Clostridium beijerinckii]